MTIHRPISPGVAAVKLAKPVEFQRLTAYWGTFLCSGRRPAHWQLTIDFVRVFSAQLRYERWLRDVPLALFTHLREIASGQYSSYQLYLWLWDGQTWGHLCDCCDGYAAGSLHSLCWSWMRPSDSWCWDLIDSVRHCSTHSPGYY